MFPKRELKDNGDGTFELRVTPPAFTGFKPSSITLNADQVDRLHEWLRGDLRIQDAFPELSAADREVILSGISAEAWDAAFGDDE